MGFGRCMHRKAPRTRRNPASRLPTGYRPGGWGGYWATARERCYDRRRFRWHLGDRRQRYGCVRSCIRGCARLSGNGRTPVEVLKAQFSVELEPGS